MKKLLLIPLTALLVMMMFATSLATSGTAHAASVQTMQPQTHYLVVTLNSNGQQVKVSRVTQDTFLKLNAQAEAKAQQMPQQITPFINRVSDTDCANRTDFWKLWNGTTIADGVCFASNGVANINVFNVFKITTGNNSGNIVLSSGQHLPGNGLQFCAGDNITFSPPIPDVTQVTITGRSSSPCMKVQ